MYMKVNLNANWFVNGTVNGAPYKFTAADTEAYYDWYYEGYTKLGNIDYSKNCHGYSFGVGDWPDDAYGANILLDANDSPPCYIPAHDLASSTVAVNGGHSLKVTGGKCTNGETGWMIFHEF